jgi:hypothetical protein
LALEDLVLVGLALVVVGIGHRPMGMGI